MTPMTKLAEAAVTFDVQKVRADFPILAEIVHGQPLVYLDNANTTQKPRQVLDALDHYYRARQREHPPRDAPAERARDARRTRARAPTCSAFINAARQRARSSSPGLHRGHQPGRAELGAARISEAGDEVLVTWMEHHSNIVPWQLVCEQTGATLKVVPDHRRGELRPRRLRAPADRRARSWSSMIHVQQRARHHQPGRRPDRAARRPRRRGRWSTARRPSPHLPVDVQAIGCDFYAFSGHKMYGPTGTGVLYGTRGAARGDAALPGRRRHDRVGDLREDRLQRAAVQVRGGHAEHRRRRRPRRRGATTSSALDRAGGAGARGRAARVRHRAACAASPACASSAEARAEDQRAVVRPRRRASARHRHDSRHRGHRGAHGPALRAAGDGPLRHPGDGARVARPSTTRATRSTRSSAGLHKVREVFG